jgi:hypothetical protein
MAFLLVLHKNSYTERFLALLSCICVLQPTLQLFATSLSPSLSGLCQFKVTIFAPLQWAHQPHLSFRIPYFFIILPCTFSISVWPMSNNIAAFVLGL